MQEEQAVIAHLVTEMVLAAPTVPNPPPQAPPGLDTLSNTLIGWLKWGVLVSGVAGLLICAGMIILGRRNRNAMATDGVLGAGWVLGGLALAASATVLVGAFMVK